MENHTSSFPGPGPGPGQDPPSSGASAPRRSRQGSLSVEEGEPEEDEESSSSSPPAEAAATTEQTLENFRKQWEAELRRSSGGSGENSALNLVTATPACLANPFPNPTSMAGAVSKGLKLPLHPFAHSKALEAVASTLDPKEAAKTPAAEVSLSGSLEDQARHWFLQGVGYERHGDLYDAVRCYRRAVQLVPDIEEKIGRGDPGVGVGGPENQRTENESDSEDEEEREVSKEEEEGEDDDDEEGSLMTRFLKQIEQKGWKFFEKAVDLGLDKKAHIGDLPVEIVSYILRWVVSNDLDVRSLDVLSSVCKGFYCVARDDKLWQMACERVWSDCEESAGEYGSFREMFLQRPRVRFDGCYIGKVTYIRAGEHSFQDQSYRPWHFVEYYRYIRFFADGKVLFLTSSEEPGAAVPGLRDKHYPRNQATLVGTYEMYGNGIISAVVSKQVPIISSGFKPKRNQEPLQQTTFHIELQISSVRGKHNWMLKWVHHACFFKKVVASGNRNPRNVSTSTTSTSFDLTANRYPPFMFSRVKSYTTKSEGILK